MRISDWSSDVFSSDLMQSVSILGGASIMLSLAMGMRQSLGLFMQPVTHDLGITAADYAFALAVQNIVWGFSQPVAGAMVDRFGTRWIAVAGGVLRSEEHTSELQSLMRISYAVFCLKKKTPDTAPAKPQPLITPHV